jgi:hypothetical protein
MLFTACDLSFDQILLLRLIQWDYCLHINYFDIVYGRIDHVNSTLAIEYMDPIEISTLELEMVLIIFPKDVFG